MVLIDYNPFVKNIIKTILIYLLLLGSVSLHAQKGDDSLIIGTKVAPPFAFKNAKGEWKGASIDLWKEIAKKLNLKYKFQENNLNSLMNKIKNNEIEIGIAAITVTASRELYADFSNGYYTEELSIAIPKNKGSIISELLDKLLSYTTLGVVFGVIIVVFVAGFAFWLMERSDKNDSKDDANNSLGSAMWWATVTMTTVGYGDVTPKTFGGKIVAVIWMILSTLMVAVLIAIFASIFTTAKRNYFITTPSDLDKGKIATVQGSFSDEYLKSRNILPVYYNSLKDALEAVNKRSADAVVYDKQLLQYIIDKDFRENLKLTKAHFMPKSYSLIFKDKCKLAEPVNRALLEVIESGKWDTIKKSYSIK
jgi:ABC-type amino acid transport substrate-binding protein